MRRIKHVADVRMLMMDMPRRVRREVSRTGKDIHKKGISELKTWTLHVPGGVRRRGPGMLTQYKTLVEVEVDRSTRLGNTRLGFSPVQRLNNMKTSLRTSS
jgi:hypothetical protein